MSEPTVADVEMHTRYLDAVSNGLSDNGYAFFAPPGRGMSHNRRTLQDGWLVRAAWFWSANSRNRTEVWREDGSGCRTEDNAGMWLPAGHLAVGCARLRPVVQVNLPQPLRKNKTTGLVTLEGSETDGR